MSMVIDGSNGLTYPNSATNGGYINGGTAVASTSGTSIDFTGIPSWVKRVTVISSAISTSGTSDWGIQLGTSGGIVSTGYVGQTVNQLNGSQSPTTFAQTIYSGLASVASYGQITLLLANASTNLWVISGSIITSGTIYSGISGYNITLSSALTTVRIKTGNGTDTFDLGSINILYE